jgi:hypothetical protein
VHGRLALFQATSINLWYSWVSRLALRVNAELAGRDSNSSAKIQTLGTGSSSRFASLQLLDTIEDMNEEEGEDDFSYDSHMIMYTYTNPGTTANVDKEFIPGFALCFIHEAAQQGFVNEIRAILGRETGGTKYYYSFLKCISDGRDYSPLYPGEFGKKWQGASPGLYRLYQRHIIGHSDRTLETACKIADNIKENNTHEDLVKSKVYSNTKKIKHFVVRMVGEGLVSFNEYYDFFIREPDDHRNVWRLIKYYLLNNREMEADSFGGSSTETEVEAAATDTEVYNQEYRDWIIAAGNTIYELFKEEYGSVARLKRLLTAAKIDKKWLRRWFDNAKIDYRNEELDYRMVELFRVLFTERLYGQGLE